VTNQLACKIVTKQVNTGGIRGTDSGWIFHGSLLRSDVLRPLDIGLQPAVSSSTSVSHCITVLTVFWAF